MDGFILAAGRGERLRPLTDSVPKALVLVAGVAMIEHVALRLIAAGADRIVANLHHLGEQVEAFVRARDGFGVPWSFSRETELLDTGGALLHARPLLRRSEPFVLHNCDVLTNFPLREMYDGHVRATTALPAGAGPIATVAVADRPSARGLVFAGEGDLSRARMVGRYSGEELRLAPGAIAGARERRRAFAGVHVIEPRLLDRITERGAFSVLDLYLRLAGEGETIRPHAVDGFFWADIGTPEKLAAAEGTLAELRTAPTGTSHRP